jgi:hypothetical protein
MIGLPAQWRDTLAETRGPASVRADLSVFSHALTVPVKEWGWLRDNPLNNVRMPHIPRRRVRYLSEEERQRLLDAYKGSCNLCLYTVVVLALSTGARKMELLSIRWRGVDVQLSNPRYSAGTCHSGLACVYQHDVVLFGPVACTMRLRTAYTSMSESPARRAKIEGAQKQFSSSADQPGASAPLRARPQGEESHTSPCGSSESIIGHSTPMQHSMCQERTVVNKG